MLAIIDNHSLAIDSKGLGRTPGLCLKFSSSLIYMIGRNGGVLAGLLIGKRDQSI